MDKQCAHYAGCMMPREPGDVYCAPCRSSINRELESPRFPLPDAFEPIPGYEESP